MPRGTVAANPDEEGRQQPALPRGEYKHERVVEVTKVSISYPYELVLVRLHSGHLDSRHRSFINLPE